MVPLSTDVKRALLEREGMMGTILNCVLEYEQGHWENVECRDLSPDAIRNAYLDAINWSARAATDAMKGE